MSGKVEGMIIVYQDDTVVVYSRIDGKMILAINRMPVLVGKPEQFIKIAKAILKSEEE
jgi:hypothetical protein